MLLSSITQPEERKHGDHDKSSGGELSNDELPSPREIPVARPPVVDLTGDGEFSDGEPSNGELPSPREIPVAHPPVVDLTGDGEFSDHDFGDDNFSDDEPGDDDFDDELPSLTKILGPSDSDEVSNPP